MVCPTEFSSRHHPAHHPDPLGLGPHSHCDVFSVAFKAGLASAQYAARIELAAAADEQPSGRAPREWLRGVAFESTHGTAAHGGAEMALRALMLLLSLASLYIYARQLARFGAAQLSPQQLAVLLQCGAACCYNNPLLLLAVPLGASFGPLAFAACVFDLCFLSLSMLLALVIADTRLSNGACPPATHRYWRDKVALCVALSLTQLVMYVEAELYLRDDPSFVYESSGIFLGCALLEGGLVITWLGWLGWLLWPVEAHVVTAQGHAQGHQEGYQGRAATAFCLAALWLFIWARESYTFKVFSRDFMSDEAFRYEAHSVVLVNAATALLAVCFAPAAASHLIAAQGGADQALRVLLHAAADAADAAAAEGGGGFAAARGVTKPKSLERFVAGWVETRGWHTWRGGGAATHSAPPPGGAAVRLEETSGWRRLEAEAVAAEAVAAPGALQARAVPAAVPAARGESALGLDWGRLTVAEALHAFVAALKAADSAGLSAGVGSEGLGAAGLAELDLLREALLQLPQARLYVQQLDWLYPAAQYASRSPYLWAVLLHDLAHAPTARRLGVLHSAAAPPPPKKGAPPLHGECERLEGGGAVGAEPHAAEVARRLAEAGLAVVASQAVAEGEGRGRGSSVRVLLIGDSAAVTAEYERLYAERLAVEEMLRPEPPPPSSADRAAAVARLLTNRAQLGSELAQLGEISYEVELEACGTAGGAAGVARPCAELVLGSFPLHDRAFNKKLSKGVEWGFELTDAHLQVLRDHYGEELAWYFALLGASVSWLCPVAVLGVGVELVKLGGNIAVSEWLWVLLGSVLACWGVLVPVLWRRRAAELRYLWDVESLDKSDRLRRNVHFRGSEVADPVTGGMMPHFSSWRRLGRFANTALQIGLQVLLLCAIEYVAYVQYVWAVERFHLVPGQLYMYYLQVYVVNSLIYLGGIMLGQYVLWSRVARWCTRLENWPYEQQAEAQYIYYIYLFIWLDGYFWSWFYAFVHIPLVETGVDMSTWNFPPFGTIVHRSFDADFWMAQHTTMVTSMLGMNQFLCFVAENVLPVLLLRLARARGKGRRARRDVTVTPTETVTDSDKTVTDSDETVTDRDVTPTPTEHVERGPDPAVRAVVRAAVLQAVDEYRLPTYSSQDDYYDVALFLGYVATYTILFPLAPVLCFVNNQLELRTDLLKINETCRRLLPQKARGIGSWEACIEFGMWAAIPMVVSFATISSRAAEIFFLASEDPAHPEHAEP